MNNGAHPTGLRQDELAGWISTWVKKELRLTDSQVAGEKTFVSYGMDSVLATMLVGDLEEKLGIRLPPTLAWDTPTIDAMSLHLAQLPASANGVPSTTDADLLARLDELSEEEIGRLLEERLGRV